eukprot:CAMPEP_0172827672 /NCGR_PEP_ID=MMETSP1075-20121228/20272_1 /TAXON_ID=2916 /ORGANISM="Ceratium fusus, Strain PA161109" /LENGTH=90 /DNA_ID=CAMNT_0013669519 /DNA_START=29 /DNA_END=301 /DNA_ORIENTATION=-
MTSRPLAWVVFLKVGRPWFSPRREKWPRTMEPMVLWLHPEMTRPSATDPPAVPVPAAAPPDVVKVRAWLPCQTLPVDPFPLEATLDVEPP